MAAWIILIAAVTVVVRFKASFESTKSAIETIASTMDKDGE